MTKKTTTADELTTELARTIVEMTKAKTLQSLQTSIEYRSNALTKEKEAHAKTKQELSETEKELSETRLAWRRCTTKLQTEIDRLGNQNDKLRDKIAELEASLLVSITPNQ